MTMIFGTVINVMNASNSFKVRTQQQADSRLAIDTFVRELRQAYTGDGTPSVVFPASIAGTITFYSPDRSDDFRLRLITYALTAGTLNRSVTTSTNTYSALTGTVSWNFAGQPTTTAPVLTGITNATLFTYLDAQNNVTTTSTTLRAVQLDLVVNQSPSTSPTAQTFHTQVDLRVTNNG